MSPRSPTPMLFNVANVAASGSSADKTPASRKRRTCSPDHTSELYKSLSSTTNAALHCLAPGPPSPLQRGVAKSGHVAGCRRGSELHCDHAAARPSSKTVPAAAWIWNPKTSNGTASSKNEPCAHTEQQNIYRETPSSCGQGMLVGVRTSEVVSCAVRQAWFPFSPATEGCHQHGAQPAPSWQKPWFGLSTCRWCTTCAAASRPTTRHARAQPCATSKAFRPTASPQRSDDRSGLQDAITTTSSHLSARSA